MGLCESAAVGEEGVGGCGLGCRWSFMKKSLREVGWGGVRY